MSNVNELIVQKLSEYPHEVSDLAVRVLQLSAVHDERAVEEEAKTILRQVVRQRESEQ